jgi:predicted metal-dependent phosphoesterase TrpH
MENSIEIQNRTIKFDLHIHSNLSDGTLTPYEIIKIAKEQNLNGISITDHDEFVEDNISEFANKNEILYINGIEFSTNITNLHILCYSFERNKKLEEFLKFQREERKKAFIKMCDKAKKMNIKLDYEECSKLLNSGKVLGRPHLAKMMFDNGYVKSVYEAFKKYLFTNGPLFVDYKKLHYKEIINLTKDIKGISVIAHPGLIKNSKKEELILDCIKNGINGIEVFYPRHNINQVKYFYKLANDFNLLIFGGSDFHGENKPDIKLGQSGLTEEEFAKLHQRIFYLCDK